MALTKPVIALDEDLVPQGVIRPCPATVPGPFLNSDATYIQCGEVEGHDGPHRVFMQWEGTDA